MADQETVESGAVEGKAAAELFLAENPRRIEIDKWWKSATICENSLSEEPRLVAYAGAVKDALLLYAQKAQEARRIARG